MASTSGVATLGNFCILEPLPQNEKLLVGASAPNPKNQKRRTHGYIIKVDYSEQRNLAAEVNKIGVNINQICKRINRTDRVYSEDVAELRKRMDEVWKLLFKAVETPKY